MDKIKKTINKKISERPILSSLILAVLGLLLAFVWAARVGDNNSDLKKILWTAGATLLFGAFLGGIIKILLDDFQHNREQRAAQVQFLSNILDDLKSAYDRVERARILVPAHESAKTYRIEMRDLIDARVKLLNVERALKRGKSRIEDPTKQKDLVSYVKSMHEYLKKLTDEFKEKYRPIALLQARYKSKRDKWLESQILGKDNEEPKSSENNDFPINQAWQELKCLPALKDFMDSSPDDTNCDSEQENLGNDTPVSDYEQEFLCPLNNATELLRDALVSI